MHRFRLEKICTYLNSLARTRQNKSVNENLIRELDRALTNLDALNVNVMVLRKCDFVARLSFDTNLTPLDLVPLDIRKRMNNIIEKWQNIIDNYENDLNDDCNRNNKVAIVPKTKDEIVKPEHLSTSLWKKLQARYNASQLFAIKYVADKLDFKQQDTRIALIQGKRSFFSVGLYYDNPLCRSTRYRENFNNHWTCFCAPL